MHRPRRIAGVVIAAIAVLAPTAHAHKGNPNFETTIEGRSGLPAGVELSVVNRDDSLLLVNRSDRDVVVVGYEGEPYARIAADGTVAVNQDSTATYLNDDRFGKVDVPDGVDGKGAPRWKVLDRSGRFTWHDHRIHWMSPARPPQVTDPDVRTKVFDWKVPFVVGTASAEVTGVLAWTPEEDGGAPVAAIAGFGALLLGGGALVLLVRRRRAAAPAGEAPREERASW